MGTRKRAGKFDTGVARRRTSRRATRARGSTERRTLEENFLRVPERASRAFERRASDERLNSSTIRGVPSDARAREMSTKIDVTSTFQGEGEDMIAALIAASQVKGGNGNAGNGRGNFDVDGDVVKEKRSFERELVPFDFGDGGDATTPSAHDVRVVKVPPAPRANETSATSGKKNGKKKDKSASGNGGAITDPRARANQVCEPQKATLTPEQQAAVLAVGQTKGNGKKKSKGNNPEANVKIATSGERYAQSSFQAAPSADQLPMPSFLRDMAPIEHPVAVKPEPRTMHQVAPPSAANLKDLLGMKPATPPPALFTPPSAQAKGQALFNNILDSANKPAPRTAQAPLPMMAPPGHPILVPPGYDSAMMGHPMGPPPPVRQKLNAIFGVPTQPPQAYPVPPPYPVAPETSGGNFQMLMNKLNTGRV